MGNGTGKEGKTSIIGKQSSQSDRERERVHRNTFIYAKEFTNAYGIDLGNKKSLFSFSWESLKREIAQDPGYLRIKAKV